MIRDVEVDGRRVDVVVTDGTITGLDVAGAGADVVVDGDGGALLPGLHDHHIHLMAAAAARSSLDVSSNGLQALDVIRRAAGGGPSPEWLRVVGYHESMAGDLDRLALDEIAPYRPVRVQHRSGAMWVLNSVGLESLAHVLGDAPPGVERDSNGRPTGRFFRVDSWLRGHLPTTSPDLTGLAGELRRTGITGVTDMTPYEATADVACLIDAQLPLRVVLTGGPALARTRFPGPVDTGPVKILFDDHDPPEFAALVEWVRVAHGAGRSVAVHCVTRAALALMVAVWRDAGTSRGDRIEHGAVVPPELAAEVAALGLTVVTQPAFVSTRGDEYLTDVDPDDLPHLWPIRSLLDAGVSVAAGSDAPFGPADPWAAIAAVCSRTTRRGHLLGRDEAVSAARALSLFLGEPGDPGAGPRRVAVGGRADLCLLDRPLAEALAAPSADLVRRTWVAGDPELNRSSGGASRP